MKNYEYFEESCFHYLQDTFSSDKIKFYQQGGYDSTTADILVQLDNNPLFYIEVKMPNAQSGQFVLKYDEGTQNFTFSEANKSSKGHALPIINYMNQHSHKFNLASTAGVELDCNKTILYDWVKSFYADKKVAFIISAISHNYIIIPLNKLDYYFDISATYRVKKSGSSQPSKKDIDIIQNYLPNTTLVRMTGFDAFNKNFIHCDDKLDEKITIGNYTYQFKLFDPDDSREIYEVRRLSNTANRNVIFSLKLKNISQDSGDLEYFKACLQLKK